MFMMPNRAMLPMNAQDEGRRYGSFVAQQVSPWTKPADNLQRIGNPTPTGQKSPWARAARMAKMMRQKSPLQTATTQTKPGLQQRAAMGATPGMGGWGPLMRLMNKGMFGGM